MRVKRFGWRPHPRPGPDGLLIAAIGDVHGRADLFEAMLRALARDVAALAPDRVLAVQLGDLIDRGPDSLACLDLARRGLADFAPAGIPVSDVALLGNHDEWLRMALDGSLGETDMHVWAGNGGLATWRSFGVAGHGPAAGLAARIRDRLPAAIRDFVAAMPWHHRVGEMLFVHAGIDPRRPLDRQGPETWLWIRDPFLHAAHWPHDLLVVHGHSIEFLSGEPVIHPHRIGLDSGAFHSGTLTAMQCLGPHLRFIQVSDG